jgi:hypothetical protein
MKYIITERQHKFLIEQEIPNWFKRRFNAANMEKHITNGEINYPTLCDDFGDEFEYADNVIRYAVNEFMTIDEDIFEDERYDEWEEMLIEMCKEKFSERLFEAYRMTCQEDDEMMFESDDKNNRINKLVFNYLDGQNFKYWDEGDGECIFVPGLTRISEEEYSEQKQRLAEGLIPSMNDLGAVQAAKDTIAKYGSDD